MCARVCACALTLSWLLSFSLMSVCVFVCMCGPISESHRRTIVACVFVCVFVRNLARKPSHRQNMHTYVHVFESCFFYCWFFFLVFNFFSSRCCFLSLFCLLKSSDLFWNSLSTFHLVFSLSLFFFLVLFGCSCWSFSINNFWHTKTTK